MSLKRPVDIIFSPRVKTKNEVGSHGEAVAHGIRVQHSLYFEDNMAVLRPLNTAMGTSGVRIVLPLNAIPELIQVLSRMIAGPLGDLLLDHEIKEDA